MERTDAVLIERLSPSNPELRTLVHNHREYERQIDKLTAQRWQTPDDQRRLAELKKLKLRGRDRIETILAQARQG